MNQLLTLIEIPLFRWRSIPLPSGNETFLMGGSLNIWGAASDRGIAQIEFDETLQDFPLSSGFFSGEAVFLSDVWTDKPTLT